MSHNATPQPLPSPHPLPPCLPTACAPPAANNYYDVITSMGLPIQLAEVDPIVASHCGGVAGILTAQRMAESNKQVCGVAWRGVVWVAV